MKRLAALFTLLGLPLISLITTPAHAHDGPDGQISHKHNEVNSQPAANTEWHAAQVGEPLFKQARVTTEAESMAAVVFRDNSSVAMRERTLLIVYGHHALRDKHAVAIGAELERGALRSRLGDLDGGPQQAIIASPSSATAMTGGNNLFKVDDAGATRIANHGDGQTDVRALQGGETKLAKGMGVKVEKAKRAAKPIVLPPTPTWTTGPQVFLTVPGKLSELRGGWLGVPEAQGGYYVELARDEPGVDVLAAVQTPSSADSFEIHGLSTGRYFVRVASIDGDQFESIPSSSHAIELVDVGLTSPGGAEPSWPADATSPIPRVLPGTALDLPAGVRCGPDLESLVARPVYRDPGLTTLVCQTDDGREVAAFPVDVVPVTAAFTDDDGFRVERGARVTREIAITSAVALPEDVFVSPSKGVSVESIEALGEGRWRVTLLVGEDAPEGEGQLELGLVAPTNGQAITPVASIAVEVVPSTKPPEPPPRPERHMVELGLAGGVFIPAPNHGLYQPSTSEQQAMKTTGQVVGRVGYYPIRFVGLELAGRVMPTRITDGQHVTAWSMRGQLVGQLATRVTPFVLVGGEMIGVASPASALGKDTDFGLVVGGGLKAFILPRLALRLGIDVGIHERLGDGFTAHVDADLGLSFVLGRRSAGRRR